MSAILILKKYPLFCRLSAGECDLHINEGDRNSSILDKIVDNCPMTNRRSHLSRSLFNRIGPKIRIAGHDHAMPHRCYQVTHHAWCLAWSSLLCPLSQSPYLRGSARFGFILTACVINVHAQNSLGWGGRQ